MLLQSEGVQAGLYSEATIHNLFLCWLICRCLVHEVSENKEKVCQCFLKSDTMSSNVSFCLQLGDVQFAVTAKRRHSPLRSRTQKILWLFLSLNITQTDEEIIILVGDWFNSWRLIDYSVSCCSSEAPFDLIVIYLPSLQICGAPQWRLVSDRPHPDMKWQRSAVNICSLDPVWMRFIHLFSIKCYLWFLYFVVGFFEMSVKLSEGLKEQWKTTCTFISAVKHSVMSELAWTWCSVQIIW